LCVKQIFGDNKKDDISEGRKNIFIY
jgi:hypothetical protein